MPQGYKRIGIVWAGRPTHNNDRNRSASLAAFAPIAAVRGVALISIQKGPAAAQAGNYFGRAPLVNIGAEINDYDDTMAILDNLDLLVTVDTSVGHLAGAMGRPVWIMIARAPDWRWLLDRTDSPWYPSVRLFRQPEHRKWDKITAAVAPRCESERADASRCTVAAARQLKRGPNLQPRVRDAVPGGRGTGGRNGARAGVAARTSRGTFTAADFRRDAFGPAPRFRCVIAEADAAVVGYATWYPAYDITSATHGLHLLDLFVEEPVRGQGYGTALIGAVARRATDAGGDWICLHVRPDTTGAPSPCIGGSAPRIWVALPRLQRRRLHHTGRAIDAP